MDNISLNIPHTNSFYSKASCLVAKTCEECTDLLQSVLRLVWHSESPVQNYTVTQLPSAAIEPVLLVFIQQDFGSRSATVKLWLAASEKDEAPCVKAVTTSVGHFGWHGNNMPALPKLNEFDVCYPVKLEELVRESLQARPSVTITLDSKGIKIVYNEDLSDELQESIITMLEQAANH